MRLRWRALDSGWGTSPVVPIKYDVYCYHVLAVVRGPDRKGGLFPQLYADNLRLCLDGDLLAAAWFASRYDRLVGQEGAPRKCFLLSTCPKTRTCMKEWDISRAGDCWSVRLDVRILPIVAGLVPFLLGFLRCFASWLSGYSGTAPLQVPSCSFARCGEVACLGLKSQLLAHCICCCCLVGSQAAGPSGAVSSLSGGPDGCDPAYFVVWTCFRMVNRYLIGLANWFVFTGCWIPSPGGEGEGGRGTVLFIFCMPGLPRMGLSGTRMSVVG